MRQNLYFIFLILLFCSACQLAEDLQDLDTPPYDPTFAFPLLNSKTTIREVLERSEDLSTIVVEPNGQLRFRYVGDVITRNSDQIFGTLTAALPPLIPVLGKRMPLPFNLPNGVKLDRVDLKAGDFSFYLENPNNEPVSVKISIPQIRKNGQALSVEVNLGAYGGSGARPSASNQNSPLSLQGYTFIPQNDTVYIQHEATTASGRSVNVALFVIRITNLKFSYAEGFFGSLLYEGGKDTVQIDFFKRYIGGNLFFADPKVTFILENAFGIPSRSIVKDFRVFTVDGRNLPVESPIMRTGIDFPYPRLNEVGQAKRDSFVFDKSNSNLDVLLGSGPRAVAYDVDAFTNPNGNTGQKGFITDKSYYKVQVEVELPLYGRGSNFSSDQSYEVNFSKFERVENVEFKVVTLNETPLDAQVQAYFLDRSGKTLDSLFAAKALVLKGATANVQGFPSGQTEQITFANFPKDRFDKIRNTQKMILRVSVSTDVSNPGRLVRLLAQQLIQVKIGAKAGL
jgi:hypothetical protein